MHGKSSIRILVIVLVAAFLAHTHSAVAGPPCPCNSDINNSGGAINVIDVAIVRDCARGVSCVMCVNSCDVDCDGDVDYYDAGVVTCAFQGQSNCCTEPAGTCANMQTGAPNPDCVVTTDNYCDLFDGTWYDNPGMCLNATLVPTVSTWGLLILTIAMLIAATLVIQRRVSASEMA